MHRSLMSMKDLPLLTAAGVRMGEIADALYDPLEQRILAFLVNWEGEVILGPDDFLPITQLLELNADIGTVADEIGVSAGLDTDLAMSRDGQMCAFEELIDRPVSDSDGNQVGRLADLQFDPQDGSIEFYELMPEEQGEPLMVPPHAGIEVRDGLLILPASAVKAARKSTRPPQLGIAFLEAEGLEDHVGEDDLEVSRSNGMEPS